MDLFEQLTQFTPYNEQEACDREELCRWLKQGDQVFERSSTSAHFTASAWVVNKEHTHVLMAYHNLYDSWAWLGGHADGDTDLLRVAMKEVREESGLQEIVPVSETIFSVEILTVDGHEKKGRYVSSHLHLNVTYLLEADMKAPLRCKPDENSQVAWFPLVEAVEASNEAWFKARVYPKLNAKLLALK